MKNYYSILHIPENAGRDAIQKTYRRLAKQYHPDINKAPDAHEKFCEITEAYEFLMNHWPLHVDQYTNSINYEQKYNDYRKTDEYEHFRREARERAHHQAKMRYEKFRKQHEAFQESGIDDIVLLFKIFVRIGSVFLFLFLLILPVLLVLQNNWKFLFTSIIAWPVAGLLAWDFYNKRHDYFIPGKFYYSPNRLKHLYKDKHPSVLHCYYCPRKIADSKPYKLDLLKLKEVKLKSGGFRQHNFNYVNQNFSILIPRSQKAFIIHSVNILIKLSSICFCLIFLNISSVVWRLIIGIALGGIISRLHLLFTRTKSNVSYIISYDLIFRVIIWLFCIIMVSRFYSKPFDIATNDFIFFVVASILIFDSFLMQLVNLALGKNSSKPVSLQFPETANKFNEGYTVYNDIPVVSVVYPLFKLIFG